MEEDAFKNLYDDLELKKQDDDNMSVNTEVPSDPWFDEEDIMASTPKGQVQEDESEKDISYSCLYGKETEETKLLVEEIDIYGDLMRIEEEEMKAKRNREIELENCKKELGNLRESDAQKSAKIEELSKKMEGLKRSICSLYKTAQNEIKRKDELLAEANRQTIKLENILFRKNEQNARQSQCTRCRNCNHENGKDNNTSKRKRSRSPEPFINAKERHFSSQKADTRVSSSDKEKKSNILDPLSRRNNSESKNEVSSRSHASRSPKSSKKERYSSVSKSSNEKSSSDKLNKCNTDHISRMDSGNNKETSKRNTSSSTRSLSGTKGNNSKSKNEVSSKSHGSRSPKSSNNEKERDSSVSKSSNEKTSSDKLNKCDTDNHISSMDSGNNKEMSKSNTSSSPISLSGTKENDSESKNEVSSKSHGSRSPKSSNNEKERDSSVSKSSNEKTSSDKLNKCDTDNHISRMDSGTNKETLSESNISPSPISLSGTEGNNSESKNEVSSKSHGSRSPKPSNNEKERDSSVSKSSNEKTSSNKLNKCNTDNHISRMDSGNNKETLSESNISASPILLSGTKEKDISNPKANDSIILPSNKDHPASTSSCPILEERKEQLTKDNVCVLYQPPQTFNFSENSRDSTETNNIFFSMLPDSLKKSFHDYEQSQIISLNKLKQSFINEYFNSDATISSTNVECSVKTSEKQGIHLKQLLFDKKSHVVASVSTSSLLTPSSEGHSSTTVTEKFQKKEYERNFRHFREVRSRERSVKTREVCKITRSDRKDLETLFRYRKERIPFSERRKFGHRNNRKSVHKKL